MNRFTFEEKSQENHYSIAIQGTDVNCRFGDNVERISGCRDAYFVYDYRECIAVLPRDKWILKGVTDLDRG